MLEKVNKVRMGNGIAPLSEQSTVWNSVVLENKGQIVEFSKVGVPNYSLVGSLIKVPRAQETEKGIVLEAVDHWSKVMEYYNVQIDQVYIDTNSGTTLKIYNKEQALEAQYLYNERVNDGTIS